jgi:hypothetical protein
MSLGCARESRLGILPPQLLQLRAVAGRVLDSGQVESEEHSRTGRMQGRDHMKEDWERGTCFFPPLQYRKNNNEKF